MSYLFISDLHLGSPLFKCEKQLTELINTIYFEKIFLVGDIIDVWEDSIENVQKKHRTLFKILNSVNELIVIRGNHDPEINELKNVFPKAKVVNFYEDDNFVVIHSHQQDLLYQRLYFLIKLTYPFIWCMERLGFKKILPWLQRYFMSSNMHQKRDEKFRKRTQDIEQRTIEGNMSKEKYIIAGHTHVPKKIETDEFSYYNCGDLVNNQTFIIYDKGIFSLEMFNE